MQRSSRLRRVWAVATTPSAYQLYNIPPSSRFISRFIESETRSTHLNRQHITRVHVRRSFSVWLLYQFCFYPAPDEGAILCGFNSAVRVQSGKLQ